VDPTTIQILIALTSLFAATVNGALGYGYSSITVPIALLMVTSRMLNPSLVIVEVVVNLYALFLARKSARRVWPSVAPVALGILPGVAAGSFVLASISPEWAKLITYATLLPLILIQAAGWRMPIQRQRLFGIPFGSGVGLLYSLTTISGPPLALYFNNQGMAKNEFKVALALTRTIESTTTLIAYAALGVLTEDSTALVPILAPGVMVGLPLGFYLIRRVDAETFRRVCMSWDAWLVAFGLSRTIARLKLLPAAWAYQVMTLTIIVDAILLRQFFGRRAARRRAQVEEVEEPAAAVPDPGLRSV
jgi:uncharacterized protein